MGPIPGPAAEPPPPPNPKKAFAVFAIVLVLSAAAFAIGVKRSNARREAERADARTSLGAPERGEAARDSLAAREAERLRKEAQEARKSIADARGYRARERELVPLEAALDRVEVLIKAGRFEEADKALDEIRLAVPPPLMPATGPGTTGTAPAVTPPATTTTTPARKPVRKKKPAKKRRRASFAPALATTA